MKPSYPPPSTPVVGGPRPRSIASTPTSGVAHPQGSGRVWVRARPLVVLAALALASPAAAQPRGKPPKPAPADKVEPAKPADAPATGAGGKGKPKVFDFTGLDLAGRLRTPQLLYFLDRASEELERASLERRSFIPAMVRSLDEHEL